MKYDLLVWTAHSCRRDVFLEELQRANLPNYASVIERGIMSVPRDSEAHSPNVRGLPTSAYGLIAFRLHDDPTCETLRTQDFLATQRAHFDAEIARLALLGTQRS